MALGRFVVCFSKVQNILQEGIYLLSAKIHGTEDDKVRVFMHKMMINQLQDIFLTLATEYGSSCEHVDNEQLILIRKQIKLQICTLMEVRNKIMHSVWVEKFWEGHPGQHNYRMLYHKNKNFQFELEDEEFDVEKLNEYSKRSLHLENFIHDFLMCISDGDTHPIYNFNDYFEFLPNEACFPRKRDIKRGNNMDHYI